MDDKRRFPKQDTLGLHLLEMAAVCGELPTDLLTRLSGSSSYTETVITSLKKDGLLKTYYKDKLRGYRLGQRAKRILLERQPERFSFYLTGNVETNRIKSEVPRRIRLHRVAETYVAMQNAGIAVFRDEKPLVFSPGGSPVAQLDSPAFYSFREVKEMGIETVKIRGSRMTGVLLAPSGVFISYNGGSHMLKWDYRAEQRAQALLQMVVCHQRLSAQHASTCVSGLLFGNDLEPFYRIFADSDTESRCFFLLDGNYEHFYYLTNDHYGDTLLKLLCSPEGTAELGHMLMQGFYPKDTGLPIEHDALDQNGNPVLFGYFLDIPRINRFHTALQLQERTGTLICFDFQKEVLHRFCGGQVGFSTISFEKFVGGFSHRQEKNTERAGHCPHRHPCRPVCGRLPGAVHRQLRPLETGGRLPWGWHFSPASHSFLLRLSARSSPPAIRDLRHFYLYRAFGGAAPFRHADRVQRHRGI